jgi:hypothetical protein
MTTAGSMMITATPLYGLTELMRAFYEEADRDGQHMPGNSRLLVTQTWAQTPHLSEEEKQRTLKSYSPHELKARTEGVPALGAGAIFPLTQESYTCAQFQLPAHFPKLFGMDVGWQFTAAVWLAFDRRTALRTHTRPISANSKHRISTPAISRRPASGSRASSILRRMPRASSTEET